MKMGNEPDSEQADHRNPSDYQLDEVLILGKRGIHRKFLKQIAGTSAAIALGPRLIGISSAQTVTVANALYHATGKRVRDLPITLDKLMG